MHEVITTWCITAWLYSIHRTHRDGSISPASTVSMPLYVDIQKHAIKSYFTHVGSHASAMRLLKSGEQHHIKAIDKTTTTKQIPYPCKEQQPCCCTSPAGTSPRGSLAGTGRTPWHADCRPPSSSPAPDPSTCPSTQSAQSCHMQTWMQCQCLAWLFYL